MNKRWS